jgi:hypothetical protein
MRTNTFFGGIVFLEAGRGILKQMAIVAVLLLCIIAVNIAVTTSPEARRISQAQELAIAQRQSERDRADFERLRKKHGLEATRVVIYEPGETPYYYGSLNQKIELK